jgi:hypothetical protein
MSGAVVGFRTHIGLEKTHFSAVISKKLVAVALLSIALRVIE